MGSPLPATNKEKQESDYPRGFDIDLPSAEAVRSNIRSKERRFSRTRRERRKLYAGNFRVQRKNPRTTGLKPGTTAEGHA